MKNSLSVIFFLLLIIGCAPKHEFKYFGLKSPGNSPELFAPGIISLDDRNESMITFSPDGKQCYFTEHEKAWKWCKINQLEFIDTSWSQPVKSKFSNDYSMCPSISADGTELFFASGRDSSMGVYECTLMPHNEWSEPVKMNEEVSSTSAEYSCHPSSKGNMFVCSWRAGAVGGCDGWRIPQVNGQYQKAENLGLLNSVVGDCVWAPGPDEQYLIFQSRRPTSIGGGGFFETDLFITFAMPDGSWSNPQNLGPEINSKATDGFAWVSHDGEYLFFSSNRRGTFDIYWVGLDSILKNTPKEPLIPISHKPGEPKFYQLYKDKEDTTTSIYFTLEKPSHTRLTICDRAGRKLKTILDEDRPEGDNHFVWKGEGFEKGEYLCELEVHDSENPIKVSVIQVLLR